MNKKKVTASLHTNDILSREQSNKHTAYYYAICQHSKCTDYCT